MKIAIIGSGYVGLCTAVGFASLGHEVVCIDIDKEKVNKINAGMAPIYEEGLEELLQKSIDKKLIHAVCDTIDVGQLDFIFIAVGTPSKDGHIDLKYIKEASETARKLIDTRSNFCTVVVKSTVLPEVTKKTIVPILEKSGKKAGKDFGVCMNPEFLREGRAIQDFFEPDRIVIGEFDKRSGDNLEKLYSNFGSPKIRTNLKTAEIIKYASNAFLATKISFINDIGNLCKKLGIDVYDVAEGMGMDKRIGKHFLQAGIGFGGSCFRKDVEALISKFAETGLDAKMVSAALAVNAGQPLRIVSLLREKMDVNGKTLAILGLAFKDGTNDVRDAPSIAIISELLKYGCILNCYDPKANEDMKKIFPDLKYFDSARDALRGSDACLLLTEWDEFKKLNEEDFNIMRNKLIIEGRRLLGKNNYSEGVCW